MAKPCEDCGNRGSYRGPFARVKYLCYDCARARGKEKEKRIQEGTRLTKKLIEKRGRSCEQCGRACGKGELHGHHKIQLADGGENTEENIILLCKDCHRQLHYG